MLRAASNFPTAYRMIASQTYVLQHILCKIYKFVKVYIFFISGRFCWKKQRMFWPSKNNLLWPRTCTSNFKTPASTPIFRLTAALAPSQYLAFRAPSNFQQHYPNFMVLGLGIIYGRSKLAKNFTMNFQYRLFHNLFQLFWWLLLRKFGTW